MYSTVIRSWLLSLIIAAFLVGCRSGVAPSNTQATQSPTRPEGPTETKKLTLTPTYTSIPSQTPQTPSPTTDVCSPSGLQLTYITEVSSGTYGAYAVDVNGLENPIPCFGEPRLLFKMPFLFYSIAWSPDGKQIAFDAAGENDSFNIFVSGWDGSNMVNLTNTPKDEDAVYPIWLPDGKNIAYTYNEPFSNEQVRVMDLHGNNVLSISTPIDPVFKFDWFTNVDRIIYISFPNEILIAELNGNIVYRFPQDYSRFASIFVIDISPDAEYIVFNASTYSKEGKSLNDIYVANIDGSGEINLTNGIGTNLGPTWSPVGDWIAYQSKSEGFYNICLVKPDGSLPILAVKGIHDLFDPAWRYVGKPK